MGELADHMLEKVANALTGADAAAWKVAAELIRTKGLEAALLAAPPTPLLEASISAEAKGDSQPPTARGQH